jgi:hypothetical protein
MVHKHNKFVKFGMLNEVNDKLSYIFLSKNLMISYQFQLLKLF